MVAPRLAVWHGVELLPRGLPNCFSSLVCVTCVGSAVDSHLWQASNSKQHASKQVGLGWAHFQYLKYEDLEDPPNVGGGYPYLRPLNAQSLGPKIPVCTSWWPLYCTKWPKLVLWGLQLAKKDRKTAQANPKRSQTSLQSMPSGSGGCK